MPLYLPPMGHSDIGVTRNTYTHLGLEDAADELKRMEELADTRKELEKVKGENPWQQNIILMFSKLFQMPPKT